MSYMQKGYNKEFFHKSSDKSFYYYVFVWLLIKGLQINLNVALNRFDFNLQKKIAKDTFNFLQLNF